MGVEEHQTFRGAQEAKEELDDEALFDAKLSNTYYKVAEVMPDNPDWFSRKMYQFVDWLDNK